MVDPPGGDGAGFAAVAGATLQALKLTDAPLHLAIAFVTAERIQELNREHRGIDKPTDVLSFPVDGASPASEAHLENAPPRELGDVIVCPEHTEDLTTAVVHGVLHLCGYDHEVDDGEMLRIQDRIMDAARLAEHSE